MLVYPNVKINLGLSVLRKRPDGYHDIETLFVPYFGMSDVLEIVPAGAFRFVGSDNVTWDDDLCVRAYQLLKADFDLPPVEIRLTKRSAVGAGLGSGSADAAFTLMTLTEMFHLGLEDWQLADYAACLGSDCPVFIYNRPMFGTGRGDVLTDYDLDLSAFEIRVEVPEGVRVSTSEAYSRVVPRERVALPSLREALRYPAEMWPDVLYNDFEPSVFSIHPEVEALKKRFYADGAVYASMSGSGSAVFGLFRK
ncbi:MAG: 4-(cytidine 5'-diphospho)-2-C-methyl-D-erythritol kinase [Bacteroidales bacterium]|jgi:4-diphosphocytidyl-2-C-methyl-D-erythritol kinase|nr:4-(cytidine 5'-diphospho)-2-C-methyl-D-erythritol kinase [Bacteroidales bacterium]